MLRNAVQVDKLRDLLLKIRSLEKPKSKPKKLRRTAGTAKHRIKELEYIRRGLEVDVLQLTRLISNGIAEEEQKLVALLELEQARYDDYLANCGDRGYDEWQRLDAERKKLQHDERCLMRQSSIEKYKEMHGALEALKATFSPEALAIILGVKK
jgi:hypothetical protein